MTKKQAKICIIKLLKKGEFLCAKVIANDFNIKDSEFKKLEVEAFLTNCKQAI